MSVEVWVTLGIAAFTGLCVLMWNTDGQMDWLCQLAAGIASVLMVGVALYDYAVIDSSLAAWQAVPSSQSAVREAVQKAVMAKRFGYPFTGFLFLVQLVLWLLPKLFVRIRVARI